MSLEAPVALAMQSFWLSVLLQGYSHIRYLLFFSMYVSVNHTTRVKSNLDSQMSKT